MNIFGQKRTDLKREDFKIVVSENLDTNSFGGTKNLKFRSTVTYIPTGEIVRSQYGFFQRGLWKDADAWLSHVVAGRARIKLISA